jgi:hypothetical protein
LAAYDLETGRLFGQFYAHKTWRQWLRFLKWLRRRYPMFSVTIRKSLAGKG